MAPEQLVLSWMSDDMLHRCGVFELVRGAWAIDQALLLVSMCIVHLQAPVSTRNRHKAACSASGRCALAIVTLAVQATALAYAQREVVEASFRAAHGAPAGLAQPLRKLVLLYALRCLAADAAWLLTQELVSLPLARALPGLH